MLTLARSYLALLLLVLPTLVSALPFYNEPPKQTRHITLPIQQRRVARNDLERRDDGLVGIVGVGDLADLFYTVSVQVGNTTTAVNLDTGSSDLWVMSDACQTRICQRSQAVPYPAASGLPTGTSVLLQYGDSTSGTNASGPVVLDTVTVAGLSMQSQAFASVNDTNNSAVKNGGAGIFGLGFPSQSFVQAAVVNYMELMHTLKFNTPTTTDQFVSNINTFGPLISRLAMEGFIEQPLFSITLQRDTIDISGQGQITIGELPRGVDNSSITWVPVRLYSSGDGGLNPPTFAPDEVYPLRWEIPLDAVFLDGQELPATTLTGASTELSALIDTGNSIIRGPQDVVNNVFNAVSPAFAADSNAQPTFPCATPHTLKFQIGGQMFPIDPRDFVGTNNKGNATTCVANNLVATDPPSRGALFSWSLGDPFFKSNRVIFYYGNLTHPSVDPPRIGFMSLVPLNASSLLQQAVQDAQADGGVFESEYKRDVKADAPSDFDQIATIDTAPTSSTVFTVDATSATPLFGAESAPETTAVSSISIAVPTSSAAPLQDVQSASSASSALPSNTAGAHSGSLPRFSSNSSLLPLLSLFLLCSYLS
ncbi:hypothetical protein EIP86_002465 [Pleurotus ostreatoroseus]|nr:hypothetical protein EIP86_002465 [Pleurotus ostreatoroseus]